MSGLMKRGNVAASLVVHTPERRMEAAKHEVQLSKSRGRHISFPGG